MKKSEILEKLDKCIKVVNENDTFHMKELQKTKDEILDLKIKIKDLEYEIDKIPKQLQNDIERIRERYIKAFNKQEERLFILENPFKFKLLQKVILNKKTDVHSIYVITKSKVVKHEYRPDLYFKSYEVIEEHTKEIKEFKENELTPINKKNGNKKNHNKN